MTCHSESSIDRLCSFSRALTFVSRPPGRKEEARFRIWRRAEGTGPGVIALDLPEGPTFLLHRHVRRRWRFSLNVDGGSRVSITRMVGGSDAEDDGHRKKCAGDFALKINDLTQVRPAC